MSITTSSSPANDFCNSFERSSDNGVLQGDSLECEGFGGFAAAFIGNQSELTNIAISAKENRINRLQ
ncbi:hypothetical protein EBR21_10380 [bacterium]|nr:hypothetical protein [bacterium]